MFCEYTSSSRSVGKLSSSAVPAAPIARRVACLAASKGFGKTNKKVVDTSPSTSYTQRPSKLLANELGIGKDAPSGPKAPSVNLAEGWKRVGDLSIFPFDRNTKPVEIDNVALMLYKFNGMVYVSDARSTAYQYPLTDAKLIMEKGVPAVEVPLDGTVYSLETGEVLKWCPKDTPMRNVLGTLKKVEKPVNLKVYPVVIEPDTSIYVKMR